MSGTSLRDCARCVLPASLALALAMTGLAACKHVGEVTGPRTETARVAALPLKRVNTEVVSQGNIIQVLAGGDLQLALERAAPGDIIELEAGAVFTGPFTLPHKPDTANGAGQWITIRSGRGAALPPPGVRVSPADTAAMARLETASGAVVRTAPGAHHYRFVGILFSPAANAGALNSLIWLGAEGKGMTAMPHHLIVERCYLRGDPELGTRRGIVMNSADTAVVDSYLADFKTGGEDSQAIIGWAGPGPYRIENNYLEAAGENLMFGGGDPDIRDLVPADIEIRKNRFSRPTRWREARWTVKNLLELKNARRVLVDGNLFEFHWPQAQNGFAILFTVRNQDGTAPWSVVEDVTFSNNIVRHVARGVNILGHDDIHSSQQTRRIHIRNNLFEHLGGSWGSGDLFQLLDGTQHIVIERNTALNGGNVLLADGRPHHGFAFRGNIVRHNRYGITGSDSAPGVPVLERYFPDWVMRANWIVGGARGDYPYGNTFPASLESVGFVDPAGGDYRLDSAGGGSTGVDFAELCPALSASEWPFFCANEGPSPP